jgi:hypothetical protein
MTGRKSTFSATNVKTIWPSGAAKVGSDPEYALFLFMQMSPFGVSQHVHAPTALKRT